MIMSPLDCRGGPTTPVFTLCGGWVGLLVAKRALKACCELGLCWMMCARWVKLLLGWEDGADILLIPKPICCCTIICCGGGGWEVV